jgi:hypothetical protein
VPASSEATENVSQPITPNLPKRHFYGTIKLDPIKAKMDFASIVDEVIQNFTLKSDVTVTISIDIQASSQNGFDESLHRIIYEICNVLKFGAADFDEGE